MLEHHWVMSTLLGRALTVHELVRHRNQKRDDNRIENLDLVIVWPDGTQQTALGALLRARGVLRYYGAAEAALRAAHAGGEAPIEASKEPEGHMAPEQHGITLRRALGQAGRSLLAVSCHCGYRPPGVLDHETEMAIHLAAVAESTMPEVPV